METSNCAPVIAVDPDAAAATPSCSHASFCQDLHRRFARSLKAMPRMAAATTERKINHPKPRLAAVTEERDPPNNLAACDHVVLVRCS
jgi:hypothetical protein